MAKRTLILQGKKVRHKIERMVHQIIEEFYNEKRITIIGIKNKGAQLSKIIKERLEEIAPFKIEPLNREPTTKSLPSFIESSKYFSCRKS